MKSSMAIFSTQGNPFPAPVKSRTHYRPSQPQMLSEEQKQTVLSPVRLPHHLSEALSPPDLHFLKGSQRLVSGLPESDSSGPFDESWPSSEGSSKTPEQDRTAIGPAMRMTGIHGSADMAEPTNEDSVIARYVARFRSGRPTSRLERSPPQSAMKEFWWLQSSSDSPDIQRFQPGSGISAGLGCSPLSLDMTPPLADGSLNDSRVCPEDVDIVRLQERAGKLILQSESSLSSGGHVSSEGVGSSPSSVSDVSRIGSSPSSVSDVSGIGSSTLDKAPAVPLPAAAFSSAHVRTRTTVPPEEDILYQWRLRRKMEQAREGALHLSTRKRSPSPPVRIPKQVLPTVDSCEMVFRNPPPIAEESTYRTAPTPTPTSCSSHVPVASPHIGPHSITGAIPPHLHLQCDVLPCVHIQPPAPCTRDPAAIRPATVLAEAGPSVPPAENRQALQPVGTGQPIQPAERRQAIQPMGTGQAIQPAESGQAEEKTAVSEQRPHRRSQRRPNGPEKKRVTSKEDKRTSEKTVLAKKAPPPPPSPVHQAMEQVISERLFSPLQSPKQKPKKKAKAPPTEEREELQPIDIAAHLLEEAEDSDGTEFRDDPLLQVLREQRQSLRSRLREVDLRLAELEGEDNEHPSHPR